MRAFIYQGKQYRSLLAFSKAQGISYDKLVKLCRHYKRARSDPGLAAAWLLGHEQFDPRTEPRTRSYNRDQRLAAARQIMHRARKRAQEEIYVASFI